MFNRLILTLLVLVSSCLGRSIIPIIDISSLYTENDDLRRVTVNKLGDACRNVGFFIIIGHKIDQAVVDLTCN